MKKILILASNPRKDLNLDTEIRDLKKVIESSRQREDFTVVDELAVRVGDLQELMLKHRPQIVHFCGHGGGEQGLVFESDVGREHLVRTEALANLFKFFSNDTECVLLNACYSEEQANAIVTHINYVVGMNQEIRDDAAIAFAKGFYRALGYACSIEEAYEFGSNAIQLEISGSSVVRSAVSEVQRKLEVIDAVTNTSIPEHLKPILKKKGTLTLDASPNSLSQETKVEIQLGIDQSLEGDFKVKQYREQVREYLSDRKLEDYEKDLLDTLRDELGLSPEKANQIIEEELAPIRQAQQAYAARLNVLIKYYPFSDDIKRELKNFQGQKNLSDEEIEQISRPMLEKAEIAYQEKQGQQAQQEYEVKLQRYEQEFRKAISAGYPIEDSVRNGLRSFQQFLELGDEDIEGIEQPIIVPKQGEYQQQLAETQRQREQEEEKTRGQARQQEAEKKEKQHQLNLKRQRQDEEGRKQLGVRLQRFEFDVITVDKKGNENSRTRKSAEFFAEDLGNEVSLDMVRIPAGTFRMGSPEGQGFGYERPQHSVTVPSFFMGKYPITQAQWRAVAALPQVEIPLDPYPSKFKGDSRPVEQVSWDEAGEFCQRVSRLTGHPYRLPSEAEWEYACRAGTTTPFYFGETLTPKLARCKANVGMALITILGGETAPVGIYLPNAFGLYDMHGQVREWCADRWHENYANAPTDGSVWITGISESRLTRGGAWNNGPADCCSASRTIFPFVRYSNLGFRVVRAVPPGLF
jgi:formylglycine-generating enzyme required for sulfatase activity